MPWTDSHIRNWFRPSKKTARSADGKIIRIFELQHSLDETILKRWAKHFRNHYCLDDEIDALRQGTGKSRKAYLEDFKFPDSTLAPGPSIRSGDFAESLVADYLEFVLNLWVPRTKFQNKSVRNESEKGCDVIGFQYLDGQPSRSDVLFIFETKAQLTGATAKQKLQEAINDSAKDLVRKGESLNAMKQRFFDKGKIVEANRVERFQNQEDNPYVEKHGSAAVFTSEIFDYDSLSLADASGHPKRDSLFLITIHGNNLMALANELYRRAADEC